MHVCVTISKREPPFYIKYGIFIPGLFAAAKENTSICGQWREAGGGKGAGELGDEGEEDRKNEIAVVKCPF